MLKTVDKYVLELKDKLPRHIENIFHKGIKKSFIVRVTHPRDYVGVSNTWSVLGVDYVYESAYWKAVHIVATDIIGEEEILSIG